jgi:hypothetical protein
MNLSRFTGIEGTGKQLIVFQIYTHPDVSLAESFLEQMKQQNMVSPFARLIQADFYNYEQSYFANHILQQVEYANSIFEILSTGSFSSIANYIYKWKQALPTYHNAISEGNL